MNFENMSPGAMAAWQALEQSWGLPLSINSAYRSPEHNAKVGGAKHSQHIHGNAFDVDVANLTREQRLALIEQARGAGFKGIGVYNNSLHFDVGPDRAWGSDYTRNSLPEWAGNVLGYPVGAPQQPQGAKPGSPAPNAPPNIFAHYRPQKLDPRNFMTSQPFGAGSVPYT